MLQLSHITKRFGGTTANDDVSILIRRGTIHAIVGENGAGKSTAMRIAYGFYTADSGEISVDGTVQQIHSPQDAISLGIGMVHQHFTLVDTMTVAENIVLGAEPGSPFALDLPSASDEIRRLSLSLGLAVDPDAVVESLSVGQQQRVELLKALYRRAAILILDEPTAVLTPQETDELFSILKSMRTQGKTVVIITHKLEEVLAISDEVTVMRDGKVVGLVQTAATSAAELAILMVGRDVILRVTRDQVRLGEAVLDVKNLAVTSSDHVQRLRGVSLSIREGEIVGIAGVEGNGQTELVEALAGLIASARVGGLVSFRGRDITALSARSRRMLGIAHIPEDRLRRGLLLPFDLRENVILGDHDRPPITGRGNVFLDRTAIEEKTSLILKNYDVRPADGALPARALSGGNQQKLIVGRELSLPPKLLLVAQPTRGVDIGAIEFIHRQLLALRAAGCAILLVSAELDEVMTLSDRLLIIHNGRIAGQVDPAATSREEIGLLMAGAPRTSQYVDH